MAVSFPAGSTVVSGTTSLTLTWPTNAVGDLALLTVVNKASTVTPATPTGWTLLVTGTGGTGTLGAGTGPVRVTIFQRVLTAVQSGTFTVTLTSGDVAMGGINLFRSDVVGATWAVTSHDPSGTGRTCRPSR